MLSRNALMLHSNIMQLRQVIHMKPVTYPFTRKLLSTGTEQKVLFEEMSPSVLHVKLNSPKSLNSVDLPMVNLILDELKQWRKDPEKTPRVMMLSGVGGKAFCAGGDVVSVYKSAKGLIPDKTIPA